MKTLWRTGFRLVLVFLLAWSCLLPVSALEIPASARLPEKMAGQDEPDQKAGFSFSEEKEDSASGTEEEKGSGLDPGWSGDGAKQNSSVTDPGENDPAEKADHPGRKDWDGLYLVKWMLKKPGESSYREIHSTRQAYHTRLKDYWPGQDLGPLTLTYKGQLYVMTFWYDTPELDKPCIIGLLWGDATFYASYVPASTITLTNYVNSTDPEALARAYPIAVDTQVDIIHAAGGIVCLDDSSQQWTIHEMVQDFAANETKTFVVPKGEDISARFIDDLSGAGYFQYGLKDKTLRPGLKVDAIIHEEESNPFNLVSSKADYIRQPAYSYGCFADDPQAPAAGLGMARVAGPGLLQADLLHPDPQNNYYGSTDFLVEDPESLKDYPAGFDQLDSEDQVILSKDGHDWSYRSSVSSVPDADYFYTVDWNRAYLAATVEAGSNSMYTSSNQPAYRLEGQIDRYVAVHFKVRLPGEDTFTDVSGHAASAVSYNQSLETLTFPDEQDLPASRTWNGISWKLVSWYEDASLTEPVNKSRKVDQALTLYAAYIPVNPVYTYGQIVDAQGNIQALMGLGMGQAYGVSLPEAADALLNTNLMDQAEISYPKDYPPITWKGQTYTYTQSSPAQGQYSIEWKSLEARDRIEAGDNQAYTPKKEPAYWLMGIIHLNPIQYDVKFVCQQPGQSGFTLLKTLQIEAGQRIPESEIPPADQPFWIYKPGTDQAQAAPIWYVDADGKVQADFSKPVDSAATFYRLYRPVSLLHVQQINNSLLEDSEKLDIDYTSTTASINCLIPAEVSDFTGPDALMAALGSTPGNWQVQNARLDEQYSFYAPKQTILSAAVTASPPGTEIYYQHGNTIVSGKELNNWPLPDQKTDLLVITAKAPYLKRAVRAVGILSDGTRMPLGQAQAAAGPLIDPALAADGVNYMDYAPAIDKETDTYPILNIEGKNYQYASPDSENASKPGYYTISSWQSLQKAASQDQAEYVLEGKIRINIYHTVSFEIRKPGQPDFKPIAGYENLKLAAGKAPATIAPSDSAVPASIEVDGVVYEFKGWFTAPSLEIQADLDQPLADDQVFYGQYMPVMRSFVLTEQTASGNVDADPDARFTFQIDFYPSAGEEITGPSGMTPVGPNSWQVSLSSQEAVHFEIPDGTEFTVTEISQQPDLYATDWSMKNGTDTLAGRDSYSTSRQKAHGNIEITFTNTRRGIVPTAFDSSGWLPWIILGTLCLGSLALMTRRSRV